MVFGFVNEGFGQIVLDLNVELLWVDSCVVVRLGRSGPLLLDIDTVIIIIGCIFRVPVTSWHTSRNVVPVRYKRWRHHVCLRDNHGVFKSPRLCKARGLSSSIVYA